MIPKQSVPALQLLIPLDFWPASSVLHFQAVYFCLVPKKKKKEKATHHPEIIATTRTKLSSFPSGVCLHLQLITCQAASPDYDVILDSLKE